MNPDLEARLAAMADRYEIQDLVRRERFARDQRLWDDMADCFHPKAHIQTSWYSGNAADYIPATQKLMEKSPHGKHWVFSGFVRIHGDRATVESPAMIFNRIPVDGVEVDFHVFCRFHSRVQRLEGRWLLMSFEVLFERDTLKTLDGVTPLPVDQEKLATYRQSYKHLAYIQENRGFTVRPDLPGDDRPDALAAFHEQERLWREAG